MEYPIDNIVRQLKIDEGFRSTPYWDTDQWTYGYGTKAPGPDATITSAEAERVLIERTHQAVDDFNKVFSHAKPMDRARFEALVNMLFNLGLTKFSRFRRLIQAAIVGDWGHAAREAFDSRWFNQLRKKGLRSIERSERIVWTLLTGEGGEK